MKLTKVELSTSRFEEDSSGRRIGEVSAQRIIFHFDVASKVGIEIGYGHPIIYVDARILSAIAASYV